MTWMPRGPGLGVGGCDGPKLGDRLRGDRFEEAQLLGVAPGSTMKVDVARRGRCFSRRGRVQAPAGRMERLALAQPVSDIGPELLQLVGHGIPHHLGAPPCQRLSRRVVFRGVVQI